MKTLHTLLALGALALVGVTFAATDRGTATTCAAKCCEAGACCESGKCEPGKCKTEKCDGGKCADASASTEATASCCAMPVKAAKSCCAE